ncbi:BspA family leucine-rich repeat surface protein [Niabella aquatica]
MQIKHLQRFVLIALLLGAGFSLMAQNDPYVTVWNTETGDPGSKEITLNIIGSNLTIDWEEVGNAANHGTITGANPANGYLLVFPSAGRYKVSVHPAGLTGLRNSGSANGVKLMTVTQWGDATFTSLNRAFSDCRNMEITAGDAPVLTNINAFGLNAMFFNADAFTGQQTPMENWQTGAITDMSDMFLGAIFFNGKIGGWDVSNVTNMLNMFSGAGAFNQNINSWDVSNVTNMTNMFNRAGTFNQPLDNWANKLGKVTSMTGMFRSAEKFNQDISSWNVSNVSSFVEMFKLALAFNQPLNAWGDDLESALYTQSMFEGALAFNQPLNSWNVGNITNLYRMFLNAAAFNQSLANWTFNANAFLEHMLYGTGLSCSNLSATLHGWANNPNTPDGRLLSDISGSYGPLGLAAYNKLVNDKGWTISGGTYDENCDESSLPVHFGPVAAILKNNELLVRWSALSETSNNHFNIQVSRDGIDFTTIVTVPSKAPGGTTDQVTNYQQIIPLPISVLSGITIAFAVLGFGIKRKSRLYLLTSVVLFVCTLFACSRQDMAGIETNEKLFVRIEQVDIDGTASYSKTVQAVRE